MSVHLVSPREEEITRIMKHTGRSLHRVASPAMRQAAGIYRRAFRQAVAPHKDSGDLSRSVAVVVKRSKRGSPYALIGFRYGKYGNPPRSTQDPAVYSIFLDKGTVARTTRRGAARGVVRGVDFASAIGRSRPLASRASRTFASRLKLDAAKLGVPQ